MKSSVVIVTFAVMILVAALAFTIQPSHASRGALHEGPGLTENEPSAVLTVPAPVFSYQGQLTNAGGNPISNTALPMTFRLFETLTGGTACWTESQNVNVQNGQFNVLLGKSLAVPASCVANDSYLELVIAGETLTPREMLTSVASAVKANTLVSGAQTQGDLTVGGALSVDNNLYAESAITSPGGSDLTIDAGWGSTNDVRMLGGLNLLNNGGADDIRMGGTTMGHTVLRRDGNRVLHFVPWGGPSYHYDEICIGCASGNVNFRVNGYLHIAHGRALVHDSNDVLTVNYAGDFSGGTRIQSNLSVWGPATIAGDLNVDRTINAAGLNVGSCHINTTSRANTTDQTECEGGTITSGAYVEANLMTNEERLTEKIARFNKGDLLCWSDEDRRLEKCSTTNNPLVMGVADANGKPIVLGAEQIKVLGPIQTGDYLVASEVPGYAIASDDPSFGIVIGQALESFEGERGMIMAMIRKM